MNTTKAGHFATSWSTGCCDCQCARPGGSPGELEMRENHSLHWCAESALTTTFLIHCPALLMSKLLSGKSWGYTWYKIFLQVLQVS